MNLTNLNNKTDAEIADIAAAAQALVLKNKYGKLFTVFPDTGSLRRELYPHALQFMRKGADKRFRVYMGGNRSGKSYTCIVELVFHMTGHYPHWWEGKRFIKPTTFWIVAESAGLFRDSAQRLLFGEAGEETGTGLIPLAEKNGGYGLLNWYSMPGNPGAIGSCTIKHKSGHMVSLVVKTNEMTREQFQAAKVDCILFDEEPKEDIYNESLMRLMSIGKTKEPGIAMLAFTPLKGLSKVVLKFLPQGQIPKAGSSIENPDQYVCRVEWDQVPHLSEAEKKASLAQIPEHLRDSRTRGIPTLGAGLIYPVIEEDVGVAPFKIPDYWPRAYGLDFGWECTCVLWGAKDPSTGILYIYSEYYIGKQSPAIHSLAIKARGEWIKGICDPSGGGRNSDGSLVMDQYANYGIELIAGDNAIIPGISRVLTGFESGMIKLFSTLNHTLEELRLYRYDSKNPNQPARNQKDHAMDTLKYLTSPNLFDWIAVTKRDSEYDSDAPKPKSHKRDPLTGY